MITVAILGRSNVSKSALFNLLFCRKKSIVGDEENLTRDMHKTLACLYDKYFEILDTPGVSYDGIMSKYTNQFACFAAIEADVIFFMVDGQVGILEEDHRVFREFRNHRKKMILLVNKCDHGVVYDRNFRVLGLDNVFYISVLRDFGFDELYDFLKNKLRDNSLNANEKKNYLRLAIIGKPNVGKSTYVDTLLRSNRVVVSDKAGTTRDSVEVEWKYRDQDILLTDTAGIYSQKTQAKTDRISVQCAKTTIKYSHVVVLVVDAIQLFGKNDWRILNLAIEEGRGVIIVVSKCDLVDRDVLQENMTTELRANNVEHVPIFYISSLEKNVYFTSNKNTRKTQKKRAQEKYKVQELDMPYKDGYYKKKYNGCNKHNKRGEYEEQCSQVQESDSQVGKYQDQETRQEHDECYNKCKKDELGNEVLASQFNKSNNPQSDNLQSDQDKSDQQRDHISVKTSDQRLRIFIPSDEVLSVYGMWQRKFTTHELNKWLQFATTKHRYKLVRGKTVKFKYIVQTFVRPITCKIFGNCDEIDASYTAYLAKSFARYFGLYGFAVRLAFAAANRKMKK